MAARKAGKTAAAPPAVKAEAGGTGSQAQEQIDAALKADEEAKAKAKEEQDALDAAALLKESDEKKARDEAALKADEEAKAKAKEEQDALDAAALEQASELPVEQWSLPAPEEFPVTLKVVNAWPGRFDVPSTGETLAAGESRDIEFTEAGYKRFSATAAQIAHLQGWKSGEGIFIEGGNHD